jgi:hypothetical protein
VRRAVGTTCLALCGLALAACAPSNNVNIGLKDYATNVVYGDPSSTTTQPPAPAPVAALSPGFPSFIVPAPPPPLPPGTPEPPARIIEYVPEACPTADAKARHIPVGPKIVGQPGPGTYTYKQEGKTSGAGAPLVLPPLGQRTIKNLKVVGGYPSWDVEIVEFGVTTTTSYRLYRPSSRPELDGLYITRIVQAAPGRAVDEFAPLDPGLRIMQEPAAPGSQWTSVATDPTHAVSMILQGTIKEKGGLDVCGLIEEGWPVDVTLTVRRPLDPAGGTNTFATTASYLVSTALGGMIIADSVKQTTVGADNKPTAERSTSSVLADLVPH